MSLIPSAQRLYDAFAARDTVALLDAMTEDFVGTVSDGMPLGAARASGRPLDAAFAHVLTIRDGRVASLEQITDTQRWHEADR
jgi:ketosteroid isomerase-like protein